MGCCDGRNKTKESLNSLEKPRGRWKAKDSQGDELTPALETEDDEKRHIYDDNLPYYDEEINNLSFNAIIYLKENNNNTAQTTSGLRILQSLNLSQLFYNSIHPQIDETPTANESYEPSASDNEVKNVDPVEYFSIDSDQISAKNVKLSPKVQKPTDCGMNLFLDLYIFFYFEISQFILYEYDYFNRLYPELNNIVMVIEINDDKSTQEKIPFMSQDKEGEMGNQIIPTYVPLMKKYDIIDLKNYNKSYRLTIPVLINKNSIDVWKIRISFGCFINKLMLDICSTEVFIENNKMDEMKKFKMYKNLFMKHHDKKVGNIIFDFAYKTAEINTKSIASEKKIMQSAFYKCESIAKFEDKPLVMFKYYNIPDVMIKDNGKRIENKDGNEAILTSNYFSVGEIEIVDISDNTFSEISLNGLLKISDTAKWKYEFYESLHKISTYFTRKEFTEEKIALFKQTLLKRLKELCEKKELFDRVLIPFLFSILKRVLFKSPFSLLGDQFMRKSAKIIENSKQGSSDGKSAGIDKNGEVKREMFLTAFEFMVLYKYPDIALSALSFIMKVVNDTKAENENDQNSDYFLELIITHELYLKLGDMMVKLYKLPECAQQILELLSKTLKFNKRDSPKLIKYITNPNFRDILSNALSMHCYNYHIMCYLLDVLLSTMDKLDLEFLCKIITMQRLRILFQIYEKKDFDILHEAIIKIIKNFFLKKNDIASNNQPVDISSITEDEYVETASIFIITLKLLNEKIAQMNFLKLVRNIYSYLLYIYNFVNILNNVNIPEGNKLTNFLIEKHTSHLLIDCLSQINDTNIFSEIDKPFKEDFTDPNLINIKIQVYRTMLHCIILIQTMKKNSPDSLSQFNADRLLMIINGIKINKKLSPDLLGAEIDKIAKSSGENAVQNLRPLLKNMKDYYLRYKDKADEFENENTTVSKVSNLNPLKNKLK